MNDPLAVITCALIPILLLGTIYLCGGFKTGNVRPYTQRRAVSYGAGYVIVEGEYAGLGKQLSGSYVSSIEKAGFQKWRVVLHSQNIETAKSVYDFINGVEGRDL